MKKQRYNVSEVAEILIDEMDSFKASAKELKKLTEEFKQTSLSIDPQSLEELRSLIEQHKGMEQQADEKRRVFLDEISCFEAKRRYRVPNGLFYTLIGLIAAVMLFSAYAWSEFKELNYLKAKIEFYESKQE